MLLTPPFWTRAWECNGVLVTFEILTALGHFLTPPLAILTVYRSFFGHFYVILEGCNLTSCNFHQFHSAVLIHTFVLGKPSFAITAKRSTVNKVFFVEHMILLTVLGHFSTPPLAILTVYSLGIFTSFWQECNLTSCRFYRSPIHTFVLGKTSFGIITAKRSTANTVFFVERMIQ